MLRNGEELKKKFKETIEFVSALIDLTEPDSGLQVGDTVSIKKEVLLIHKFLFRIDERFRITDIYGEKCTIEGLNVIRSAGNVPISYFKKVKYSKNSIRR